MTMNSLHLTSIVWFEN